METAFQMQREAAEAFDISREPEHIRELYGDSDFGQSCLLARRLAERGVRFVQVYYSRRTTNSPGTPTPTTTSGHRSSAPTATAPPPPCSPT